MTYGYSEPQANVSQSKPVHERLREEAERFKSKGFAETAKLLDALADEVISYKARMIVDGEILLITLLARVEELEATLKEVADNAHDPLHVGRVARRARAALEGEK